MVTRDERIRTLKDNRVLFLHLLEENSVAKFHEMLAECPMHKDMCYDANADNVSFAV